MADLIFYLGGLCILMLFAALWENASRKAERLSRALSDANDVCRAMAEIAERHGQETNWPGVKHYLRNSLRRQHEVMYPEEYKTRNPQHGDRT